jgi:Glycosyl hydrolase family 10
MRPLFLAVALLLCASVTRAARPIVIGTNDGGPLSRAAHVGWTRVSVYWSSIEPQPAQWTWTQADAVVDDARSNNQQVLFILSGAPGWACGCTNGAKPPAIDLWKRYVAQVAAHMKGRIAAYEIWNEPDLSDNTSFGVGWDADVTVAPRYVDYLAEAARIIRSVDPAARVVGPALSGGLNFRTYQILSQLETTEFPDGNASAFVDIVSVHANAHDDWTAADAAEKLWTNKLSFLQQYNPKNVGKPIWVTEFGWSSDLIGEEAQRDRIRDFAVGMTGENARLAPFRITHAFIYVLGRGCETGQSLYRCDGTPKAAVTGYLRTLEFPAVQAVRPPFPAEGAKFYTLPPCRVLDTREPDGPLGGPPLGGYTQRRFPVALSCGLPATARAISGNLTVTLPAAGGFLILFAGDAAPFASTLNYRAGQTRANDFIVDLTPVGTISVGCGQLSGNAGVIVDVNGYFE